MFYYFIVSKIILVVDFQFMQILLHGLIKQYKHHATTTYVIPITTACVFWKTVYLYTIFVRNIANIGAYNIKLLENIICKVHNKTTSVNPRYLEFSI